MYACICHAVTEDEVALAAMAGAVTVEAVTEATEAGGSCGTCHDTIEGIIERTCPLRKGGSIDLTCQVTTAFAQSLSA